VAKRGKLRLNPGNSPLLISTSDHFGEYMTQELLWKEDWSVCKRNLIRWWRHEGLVLHLVAQRSEPVEQIKPIAPPENWLDYWIDPVYRCNAAEVYMANHTYLAEAFPYFDTQIGPGSLGTFLGSTPQFADGTVWYEPCINDPNNNGTVSFIAHQNHWLDVHLALINTGLANARGRYLVGIPDLIENMDTLAALRGDTPLFYDLVERPGWVLDRLAEINRAYFEVFNLIYEKVKTEDGGNAFSAFALWGPGKTAKIQCDISASLSPKMFRRFVVPYLTEQCRWLDFSMYHLDGTTCLQHLDSLLAIEELAAIEWTPQAGLPDGGSRVWYDLYTRIKSGGKSVQVVGVDPKELIPLLDAVGPKGTFVIFKDEIDQAVAEQLLKLTESYY
jgi:hypothetical protein